MVSAALTLNRRALEYAPQEIPKTVFGDYFDHNDAEKFANCWTEDGSWTINNGHPTRGRRAIKQMMQRLQTVVKASRHFDLVSQCSDEHIFTQGKIEYTMLDDTKIVVSFCDVYQLARNSTLDNFKIKAAWSYGDFSAIGM
eukprot:Clim_evm13s43 gene=Clim_evmTU13s43